MGLTATLAEARTLAGMEPGQAPIRFRPRVGPALGFGFSMAALQAALRRAALAEEGGSAKPAPMGLSEPRNSENPRGRYGLQGLTANGRRSIRNACAVLEEVRACLAFWTVTLDDQSQELLAALDAWDSFQDRIRRELRRRLKAAGLPGAVVGVAEIHPKRSERLGRPVCHLHVVFQARRTRWNPWALDRWVLDGIIRAAFRSATGSSTSTKAAGNVQQVRRSCGAYLAKYMSKAGKGVGVCVAAGIGLPRQWWFWSAEMRRLVLGATVSLPIGFVLWLHHHREGMTGLGRVSMGTVRGMPESAPVVWWGKWSSAWALVGALREWMVQTAPVPA